MTFKISHSKMKYGNRCLYAYYLRYIRKLRPRVKSKPLEVGTLLHECIQSWCEKGVYTPVLKRWKRDSFDKMFQEEKELFKDVIPEAETIMRGWVANWKKSGLEMLWVEKEFEVEISPGIFLIGKIDGLAQDEKGSKWLVEHKSCKKIPDEDVRLFDVQAIIYGAVLPKVDPKVKKLSGVVWDYLRTKVPTVPQVLKSGGLSTAKNQDTTYEVYLRELRRHGLDPEGYSDFLDDLKARTSQFYRQVKLPLNPVMKTTVVDELVATSKRLILLENELESGNNLFTRSIGKECSWCDYRDLCHSEVRGDDTSFLMKKQYVVKEEDK